MFEIFEFLEADRGARQAPIMFGDPEPFKLKLWVCADCLRVAPAIGLQAECPPTDWKRVEVDCSDVEAIAFHKRYHFLLCPECKERPE